MGGEGGSSGSRLNARSAVVTHRLTPEFKPPPLGVLLYIGGGYFGQIWLFFGFLTLFSGFLTVFWGFWSFLGGFWVIFGGFDPFFGVFGHFGGVKWSILVILGGFWRMGVYCGKIPYFELFWRFFTPPGSLHYSAHAGEGSGFSVFSIEPVVKIDINFLQ